jgi:hypothetical protein
MTPYKKTMLLLDKAVKKRSSIFTGCPISSLRRDEVNYLDGQIEAYRQILHAFHKGE